MVERMGANGHTGDGRISTLLLVGETEVVLSASQGRIHFDNCSRHDEHFQGSQEQTLTLTLENEHERRAYNSSTSPIEEDIVPIIVSPPSTTRFELLPAEAVPSPFECALSCNSPKIYIVRFKRPVVSESDYAWDNFQDQVVIHTRLSKLVIRLEAWKFKTSPAFEHEHDSGLLFPASLPEVKAPPLKLFSAIERQTATQLMTLGDNETLDTSEPVSEIRTPRTESLPPLSRPSSHEQQMSPLLSSRTSRTTSSDDKSVQLLCPSVTELQSQREAREVILKLRRRRTVQSNANVMNAALGAPAIDTYNELSPETVALDAKTKAELDEFNNLVVAAIDQVAKDAAKAKSDLAYYQQILPVPPHQRDSETLTAAFESRIDVITTQKPRKPRQMPTAIKRPSKLPSLARPSSGSSTTNTKETELQTSVSNQEVLVAKVLDQQPSTRPRVPARQQISRAAKLKSLPTSHEIRQSSQMNHSKISAHTKVPTRNVQKEQKQKLDHKTILSDFDDPDPAVDEAPIVPDDLAGVATLDDDDIHM